VNIKTRFGQDYNFRSQFNGCRKILMKDLNTFLLLKMV